LMQGENGVKALPGLSSTPSKVAPGTNFTLGAGFTPVPQAPLGRLWLGIAMLVWHVVRDSRI